MDNCKKTGGALHLVGLLSDGGVHSMNTHLYALLEMAKRRNVEKVYVHCLMDGRDVPPTSGAGYIRQLEERIPSSADTITWTATTAGSASRKATT